MLGPPSALSAAGPPLEAVITTDELASRPSREPDLAAENAVFLRLAECMTVAPQRVLQELVEHARALCRAGSAGISLLDPQRPDTESRFRWVATAGAFDEYLGHTMPRHFSPCGSVLDVNRTLMMTDPDRHFTYMAGLSQPVREVVLVPFYRDGEAIGTVWVAAHTADRHFDREDARVVTNLSKFAAAAVQVITNAEAQLARLAQDVAERKRAEAALAADLNDTRKLRDLAARLISDEDPSALVDEILLAAIEITGAAAGTIQVLDETSGTPRFLASRGFDPESLVRFREVDATSGSPCGLALARGERTFVVFDDPSIPDPDSSLQWHRDEGLSCAQSTPLISRSGRQLGMFSTHWEQRCELTERELRYLDLLGRQAADLIERSQAQEALRANEEKLREADRRKDEFLAVLAHELRNPLVPIRTGVELLARAAEQPALIEKIRPMMERQLHHIVRLVDDLLDISRIASGKIELQPQPVSVASLIASAIEPNRQAIKEAKLTLSQQLDDPEFMLDVDPMRISQVISNIVHNATKFTPAGGRIQITAAIDRTGPLADLVLSVADTGIGIPSDQLPGVFGLFTQVHSRDAQRGGLGIGLALARSLIEMHGGSISAASDGPDQGTRFTMRIPATSRASSLSSQQAPAAHVLDGQRVLIVDDNRDAADSTGLLIAQVGTEVRVAYDGASALDILEEFPATFILLDIGMEGLDGYQTCRRIRTLKGDTVSVTAISGWGQPEDRRRAEEAGFDAHLTKPVDLSRLATLPLPRDGHRAASATGQPLN